MHVEWGLDHGTWAAALAGCPDATFFHTPAWHRAVAQAFQLDPLRVTLADGTPVVLPIATRPAFRGLLVRAEAGVESGYGGLVAPRPLTAPEVDAVVAIARKRYPTLTIAGSPHGQTPLHGTPAWDATRVLAVLDPEAQAHGLSSMRLRHFKAARKAGLRLEAVACPGVDWAARIYPLYQDHAAQWAYQRWVRDEAYFRALLRECAPHLRLYLAWDGEQLVGLHLVAEHGLTAIQLHLATDAAANKRNPGTLLVMAALAAAHARGLTTFDFLPSGRLESVQAFKESFGARPLPFARIHHASRLERWLTAARHVWRPAAGYMMEA